ncbi:queuosine precursor transporter [Opitutus terrae]|uniref:Probable queuosine precursor transporter n=1 Tax=Opitutus terrae (strain DSM 11246 / JCM 15787 / PB90-1) TaxID=452637 RepID=B1ZNM9_OPITP|nr:queuosine precursor transporter [Opitutus terrae]ACB74466.1 conserved hypothetical integral membrane protein [Opitutus terrae PB90-1]
MEQEPKLPAKTTTFIWLLSVHTSLLIASNAGGAKMIAVFGGLAASATVFSYSMTFPICDIVNELYGKRAARLLVNVGLAGLVVSVCFFQVSIWAPPASFWKAQDAYVTTLGLGPRILLGGWLSYLVGNHVDVIVFHWIKRYTGEKHFWIRKNLSTAVSQALDTVIFMTIAFYGVFPIASAIPGQYLLKFAVALVCTPLSYLVLSVVRRSLQNDAASAAPQVAAT